MRRLACLAVVGLVGAPGCAGAQTPEFNVVAPTFVALQVRDVDAAEEWYASVFGLSLANSIDAESGAYRIRILSNDLVRVELVEEGRAAAPPARHFGLFKAGIFVDDAEAALRALRQGGVDTDDDTFFDSALNVRTFVIRDLEGNRIQFMEVCGPSCS